MQRHGAPLKDRREKREASRGARKRFELERELEQLVNELHPAEIRLIELESMFGKEKEKREEE